MNRIGVIDIGSNSVRMTLAEIENSGFFKIIDELKESIRLGSDEKQCQIITKEKLDLTLSTVKAFKSMCISSGASKIITIATESVKNVYLKDDFIERFKTELCIDVKILKSDEELYYNFLGARNSIFIENSLLVDINGNSVHLAWIVNNEIKEKVSLPFGYVTLNSLFNLSDLITSESNEKLISFIVDNLENISWLKDRKFNSVIGIGGSIRNLGKIHRRKTRYPIDISHNYMFYDYDIDDLYHMLKSKNLKQRHKVDGLSHNRADVIVSASAILNEILKLTNTSKVQISGRALREGLLYEYLEQHFKTYCDILTFSLEGIMETLNVNRPHSYNVYKITNKLFDELKPIHHLNDEFKNILKTASLLHDCGISIRYYDHHIHSLYIILNSQINGLTHRELLMSAFCAGFHRNNNFQIGIIKYSSIINKLDVSHIEHIGILLRIAEGLDRSLVGAVSDLEVELGDDFVKIKLFSKEDLDLEIRQANRSKCKFFEIYKKELLIEQA